MSQTTNGTARARIDQLLDAGSFVELGSYVTSRSTDFNMTDVKTPADGVLTGYGTIDSNLVYVYSQDSSVLGGSMGEMHAKKIAHLYSQAMKMGAPIIGLVDCAGLRLQEATDALHGFGKLYKRQAMASGVIPQIQAVFGMCGGGMAISAGLADFTFMEESKAKLFVNSPNAILGNSESSCDTAGSKFQSEETGLVDFVGSESDILAQIRSLVDILPANNEENLSFEECTDDLNRLVPEIGASFGDPASALRSISDNNFFFELKKDFAPEMVVGFVRLNGATVGCVANRTVKYNQDGTEGEKFEAVLTHEGCSKASKLISFCDAFDIPVVTLVNSTGFKATKCTERHMPTEASKLTYAYASATVPMVTVITEKALGSAYLTMGSKAIGADMVYAWPTSKVGLMDAKEAVKIIYANEIEAASDKLSVINEKAAEYDKLQSSSLSAASRGYVDDIIEPAETRKRIIAALEMLFTKREDSPARKHGSVY